MKRLFIFSNSLNCLFFVSIAFSSIGNGPIECFNKYGNHSYDKTDNKGFRKIVYKRNELEVTALFKDNKAEEICYQLMDPSKIFSKNDVRNILLNNGIISNSKDKYLNPNYSHIIEDNKIVIWNNKFGKKLVDNILPALTPRPTPIPDIKPEIIQEPPITILEKGDRHKMLLLLRSQNYISSIRKNEDIPDKELINLFNEAKKFKAIRDGFNQMKSQ
jgi:hypothetical protein